MSKEKVYIVVTHKNSLKQGTRDQWEVEERVEFVNQLKKRHNETATAIGDYLNREMIKGKRYGMDDYQKFEDYIRAKYGQQLKQLDNAYRPENLEPEKVENVTPLQVDDAGVITVAD